MAAEDEPLQEHRNVPCPFCGLVCDDLTVAVRGEAVDLREGGCERSREELAQAGVAPFRDGEPLIAGEPASLEAAITRAADLLRSSDFPLVAGLGAEGGGIRAAIQLAERLQGAVDHMHSPALMSHVRVLQDSGWMTATLSELRNRPDRVLLLGTPLGDQVPRLYERLIRPVAGLFPERLAGRQVIALGQPEVTAAEGAIDQTLICRPHDIREVMEAVRALANGHALQAESVAGIDRDALAELAKWLTGADYGAIVWATGAMAGDNGDLTVAAICDLVRDLNRTTRCAGIPLGGGDGDQTALQATAWQTGFPVRVRFRGEGPSYAPLTGGARDLLDRAEPDALVWISAFDGHPPPATEAPTVVLGRGGMELPAPPAVYIPVGTPGVDHGGPLFRCDGAVSLPLRALRSAPVPAAEEVLARIEARL